MAVPARNIAFPIFLLVILAFLLLLFLKVWLWEAPSTGETPEFRPQEKTAIPDRSPPSDTAEPSRPTLAATTEDPPAPGETAVAESTAPRLDTEAPVDADAAEVRAEAPLRAPPPDGRESESTAPRGGGGGSGATPSPARQDAGAGAGGGIEGSTYVDIPDTSRQAQEAPHEPEPEAEVTPEEEPPPEEEEPAPEPPSPRKKRKPAEEQPTSTAIVQAVPSLSELTVEGSLSVVVMISNATNVGHVPFHLVYDPQVLLFEYGEEGSFLGSDGAQTAFFAAASGGGGIVVVGLSRLGQTTGVSGAGDLCVLHFRAVGPGTTALAFSSEKVKDPAGDPIPYVFTPVSITVR